MLGGLCGPVVAYQSMGWSMSQLCDIYKSFFVGLIPVISSGDVRVIAMLSFKFVMTLCEALSLEMEVFMDSALGTCPRITL